MYRRPPKSTRTNHLFPSPPPFRPGVINNIPRRTRTGYALMQSRKLIVTGNRSEQDQNYGILMNYITYSTITGNFVSDVQRGDTGGDSMISGGEGTALFIYTSLFNTIENTHFEKSSLGIHLPAGSEEHPNGSDPWRE